jgi:plastocyanin
MVITLLGLGIVAESARGATHDVSVGNNAFTPAQLTVEQGDVVNWNWVGPDTNHSTTTEADHETSWDSDRGNAFPNHPVGDRFSKELQMTGEYPYHCKVHPEMTGKIIVVPRGQPVPLADDVVAPRLATPRISVKRRRVNFKLDEAAAVQGKLRGRRTRRKFKMNAQAGTNVLKLPRMRPGRYALALWATDDAGNKSVVVRRKFTVRRARR